MELKILHVKDQNSYRSIWFNKEKVCDSSDGLMIEDVLHLMADFVNQNCVERVEVNTYNLWDVSTSDIPDCVKDEESFIKWHFERTGEAPEEGW